MKKALGIAVIATAILSLTGCVNSDKPQITEPTPARKTASSIVETAAPDENPSVSFSDSKENPEETAAADNSDTAQTKAAPPATQENSEAESQLPSAATQNGSVQSEPPKAVAPETPPSKQETQPTERPEPKPPQPTTSIPSEPTEPVQPTKPSYSQSDYDRIIREVTAHAESYADKGFTFAWLDSMEFGWDVGYMGTPRIERDGLDGTIRILKHHIDKIVEISTNPAYGITTDTMTYKVVQITIDGDIAFAVIYGG